MAEPPPLVMWDTSCRDWKERIRTGRPLMPDLPLFKDEAELGLAMFEEIELPDVEGYPRLGESAGDWFKDLVRAFFGSWDRNTRRRFIKEFFLLIPKKNSKTTYAAALMLTVMMMNTQRNEVYIIVSPSLSASDMSFDQAERMIERMPALARRFKPRSHIREIEDLKTGSILKIKTFDDKIMTGQIPAGALIDELHLLGKHPKAAKVLAQLTGGMLPKPNAFIITITTQSDDEPTGVFKDNLTIARKVRDGEISLPWLPLLYEFPQEIQASDAWRNPAIWHQVNPNAGRSVTVAGIQALYNVAKEKGEAEIRIWASQHLNIEINVGLRAAGWAGALFWEKHGDKELTLELLLASSEVVVVGVDGGGLDDLLGLCVIGRERDTRRWLVWTKAWAHEIVLERHKLIESRLREFQKIDQLSIVPNESSKDIEELANIIVQIRDAGLFPEDGAIGCDPVGITDIVDELERRGFSVSKEGVMGEIEQVAQGYKLQPMIKHVERRVAEGGLVHGDSPMMNWCVGNAKVEQTGNAMMLTKQMAGSAKIDPVMAMFCAATMMSFNPQPRRVPEYEMLFL